MRVDWREGFRIGEEEDSEAKKSVGVSRSMRRTEESIVKFKLKKQIKTRNKTEGKNNRTYRTKKKAKKSLLKVVISSIQITADSSYSAVVE